MRLNWSRYFSTREKRYGRGVYGDGNSSAVKLFASYFIWKIENPPSNNRSSKYVYVKEIWSGPIEPLDVSKVEVHHLATFK